MCLRFASRRRRKSRSGPTYLADNKIALNAGWVEDLLASELQALSSLELEFDLEITGFPIAEIDGLIEGLEPEEAGDPRADRLPELDEAQTRCQPGDLWQLGRHRLVCGNALDAATVARLMDGEAAQLIFTDPPYNVAIDGHVGGAGKIKHREFAMASSEMVNQRRHIPVELF